jgi:hypothetical protein
MQYRRFYSNRTQRHFQLPMVGPGLYRFRDRVWNEKYLAAIGLCPSTTEAQRPADLPPADLPIAPAPETTPAPPTASATSLSVETTLPTVAAVLDKALGESQSQTLPIPAAQAAEPALAGVSSTL